jgi:hypothetical protein
MKLPRLLRRDPARIPAPFIVGIPRSGTTLLRLMLDAHPAMAIPPETYFAPDVIDMCKEGVTPADLVAHLEAGRRWDDFSMDAEALERQLASHGQPTARRALRAFYELYAETHGKERWGDKTPRYVREMKRIGRVLPEARFIHMIRDGRDAAVSHRDVTVKEPKSMRRHAMRWKRRIRRARRHSESLAGYIEVRYEDLVSEPERELRRVCELIELDWDPAMLAYHERAPERMNEIARPLPGETERVPKSSTERLAAFGLTTQPPRTDRIARWRGSMTEAERVEYEDVAADLLAELGYEVGVPISDDPPTS